MLALRKHVDRLHAPDGVARGDERPHVAGERARLAGDVQHACGCETGEQLDDGRRTRARRIEDHEIGVREPALAEEAIGGADLEADVPESGRGGACGAVGDAARVLVDADDGGRAPCERQAQVAGAAKRSSTRAPAPAKSTTVRTRRRFASGFTWVKVPARCTAGGTSASEATASAVAP